jgi:2-keto-4-pentenoate hydratase/2-oxohepta-3-ene-1,7-dioic acid hydratase in catechol pathway
MNPKTWLRAGDVVRVGSAGLGSIENRVIEEPVVSS